VIFHSYASLPEGMGNKHGDDGIPMTSETPIDGDCTMLKLVVYIWLAENLG